MNLIEILENSILLEAVRISNGKEAVELIKNKKIGVKIDPSYINADPISLEKIMDEAIKKAGTNNAVAAVQLIVNKVPYSLAESSIETVTELIKYKNRPWAKEVSGFSDILNFGSNIKYNSRGWKLVLERVKAESQRHGHGDANEVKTLYDDGTWTMYTPLSFKGAKAVSYYGKKGEKQTPTEWCTRSEEYQYNNYTTKYHLHVIRNWKTGKSYQMAYDGHRIDFLDQKDVKGDSVSRGDLTSLPDEMLKKMEFYKELDLTDYKKRYDEATKDKKAILDKTLDPNKARWGKEIKVIENVYKREWLNYGKGDPLTAYQYNNRVSMRRDPGPRMFKYYFKDNPNIFITNNIDEDTVMWYTDSKGKTLELYDIEDIDLRDEVEETGETLEYYANQDNGSRKRDEREDQWHDYFNGSDISETYIEREFQKDEQFKKSIEDYLSKKLNKKVNVYDIKLGGRGNPGSVMPSALNIETKIGDKVIYLSFINPDKNHIKYSMKDYRDSNYIDDSAEEKLEAMVSAEVKKVAKILLKNKRLKNIRQMHRKEDPSRKYEPGTKRMYFENYFPY